MGSFIAKQPNGLYCRFSSIVDCPTHWNMTEEDYIEMCAEKAREEAKEILKHYIKQFEDVIGYFRSTSNMSQQEFDKWLEEVSKK